MKNLITILIIIISFSACTKRDNRKVVNDVDNKTETKNDIKTVTIADLPIHIDSTDVMIHPIGSYVLSRNKSEYSEYGSYRSDSYPEMNGISNNHGDRITGDISNLKFQNINSNKLISLTNRTLSIRSILFLRNIYKTTGNDYLLYDVIDKDTNADGEYNFKDIKTLYISNLDGSSFRKLSPNLQDMVNWKIILEANTLFFKSIEDSDNNGKFNKKDKMHYFYLDLSNKTSEVIEYYPI